MDKILANELQPGVLLKIFDGEEYIEKTVKKIIVCQHRLKDNWSKVHGVEILLCRRKNLYFIYNMYLDDTSWVKSIEIILKKTHKWTL